MKATHALLVLAVLSYAAAIAQTNTANVTVIRAGTLIDADGQHLHALAVMSAVKGLNGRHLQVARSAPGGPERYHHRFLTAVAGKLHILAAQGLQREVRREATC